MHWVEGAGHGFVQLDESAFLAFCQVPGVEQVESTVGVTHAGTGAGVSAPGTMQHLAMKVGSEEELLALRDRLRTNGVVVMGPLDHGMCRPLYFAGPECLTLAAAWSRASIAHDRLIDHQVSEAAGTNPAAQARLR